MNSIGPKTKHWGTPDVTSWPLEYFPDTYTWCERLLKYDLNQEIEFLFLLYIFKGFFFNKNSWLIKSNGFIRSRNICHYKFLFIYCFNLVANNWS
jgi:hypothetical protein